MSRTILCWYLLLSGASLSVYGRGGGGGGGGSGGGKGDDSSEDDSDSSNSDFDSGMEAALGIDGKDPSDAPWWAYPFLIILCIIFCICFVCLFKYVHRKCCINGKCGNCCQNCKKPKFNINKGNVNYVERNGDYQRRYSESASTNANHNAIELNETNTTPQV